MNNQGGFTIIEVTIFLAVTAMLLTIAMVGVTRAVNSARFTDSTRSLESFVQQQFDSVVNGVNIRSGQEICDSSGAVIDVAPATGANPGTSQSCLLLGKQISITPLSSDITVNYIVGVKPGVDPVTSNEREILKAYNPTVVTAAYTETFTIPWSAEVLQAWRPTTSSGDAVTRIAFIRSPISPSIYTFTYLPPTPAEKLANVVDAAAAVNRQTNICIKSRDRVGIDGAITLAADARSQVAISSRADISGSNRMAVCGL